MRIHNVAITGFGPFRHTQVVDFDAFAADGLFLITGRTGAGKSSILDAICFALYGAIPRYGSDSNTTKLRSDHSAAQEPSEVRLEFSVGSTRYRVTRTPEYVRPTKNGKGETTAASTVELAVLGTDWEVTHTRQREVGRAIAEIVKLSRDEFQQVILLAQNRFHEFLTAKDDERQAVLRTLFNTERFQGYEVALNERKKALEHAKVDAELTHHAALRQAADVAGPDTIPTLPTIVDAATTAEAETLSLDEVAKSAKDEYDAALQHHSQTTLTHSYQQRANAAKEVRARLLANAAVIASDKVRLGNAERADKVVPYRSIKSSAAAELDTAVTAEQAARLVNPDAPATADELAAEVDTTAKAIGGLADALELERSLPNLEREVTDAITVRDSAERLVSEAETRKQAIPGERKALSDRTTEVAGIAARADDLHSSVEALKTASTAATEAADLDGKLRNALARQYDAGTVRTKASRDLDQLRAKHLTGYAAELATHLIDGEPCGVCGSTTHPAPTVATHALVTDAELEDAENAVIDAEKLERLATDTVNDLKEKLAGEEARMGGKTAEQITDALAGARNELEAAREAQRKIVQLREGIEKLDSESSTLDEDLRPLIQRRDEATAAVTSAQTTLAAAQTSVVGNRAEFATVKERHASLQDAHTSTQNLLTAMRLATERKTAYTDADERFREALEEHGFETEAELNSSVLTAFEQEALRKSIKDAEVELARVEHELAQPELANLPEQLVDLDAAADAVADAEGRRDTSRDAANQARARAEYLQKAVPVLTAEADALEDVAKEFEVIQSLAASVRGETPNTMQMKLEAFVLAAELEEIVKAANVRLREMSDGRYELAHSDELRGRRAQSGLGLQVIDSHTGRSRSTQSLSGGESFLASLALALGLAEVVSNRAGGIRLETLFIDEGFGSLDSDTLEIAMGTLDSLRSSGRTVGLISHVETMKEQIPAKLSLEVADGGWSVITQPPAA